MNLKTSVFLWLVAEGKAKDLEQEKDWSAVVDFEDGGGTCKDQRAALRSWEWPRLSQAFQPYGCKELDSASNPNNPGNEFFPTASREEPNLVNTWSLLYETLSRELSWAPLDFQPRELWANQWMLFEAAKFVAICYGSERKLMYIEMFQ